MNVSTEGRIERSVLKFVDSSEGRAELRLRKGDVLFNNTNSPELVGKTALFADADAPAFSNHMTRLRVDTTKLDPSFLAVRLHQAWRDGWFATHCNNHVSQASIGRDVLQAFEFEVPPLQVQRAIAQLSQAVDGERRSSKDHLEGARRSIDRFRQAILAAACSGRLTAEWRGIEERQEDAASLVAAIDARRRDRLGRRYKEMAAPPVGDQLPQGWVWTTIGALVEVATGATPLRNRSDYYNGTIPWVTSGAVNAGLITEASEHITEAALSETNAKVFPAGTMLVAMYGEGQTRGRVAQLGLDAATNQAVAALVFDELSVKIRPYLRLFLLENYERIRRLSFGGVQPNLSLGVIRDTAVPLPPAEEQAEIARRVEQLLEPIHRLRERTDLVEKQIEKCSQAVLAKAFRGEVAPSTLDEV